MASKTRATIGRLLAAVAFGIAVAAVPAPAGAGTAGIDPSGCGTGETWRFVDFNVNGAIMRQEVRHSYGCGGVGWGRLSRVGGSSPALALIQTAWNVGGPSQDGVPGTNWTYTVDASPGKRVCAGFHAWSIDWLGNRHYINWFDAGCYTA